nr:MAG TPA: hypothetical protein [Caudoviricetes sp.]
MTTGGFYFCKNEILMKIHLIACNLQANRL